MLTIGGLSLIGMATYTTLLMAPLGASAVLLFSAPESPLARIRNQLGGHSIAAVIGLIAITLPEQGPLVSAIAIAVTVTLMSLFSCEHPPAGAVPLVMILGDVEPSFLLGPVLCGVIFLTLMTHLFHLALRTMGIKKQTV